jgi:hypothetical protein
MNNELAWSLLDPRPVMVHHVDYDVELCYWNGQVMTRTYALITAARIWSNMHAVETVKQAAWRQFSRCWSLGVFADYDMGEHLSEKDHTSYPAYLVYLIQKSDREFFTRLVNQYTAKQAMTWFGQPSTVYVKSSNKQNAVEF